METLRDQLDPEFVSALCKICTANRNQIEDQLPNLPERRLQVIAMKSTGVVLSALKAICEENDYTPEQLLNHMTKLGAVAKRTLGAEEQESLRGAH